MVRRIFNGVCTFVKFFLIQLRIIQNEFFKREEVQIIKVLDTKLILDQYYKDNELKKLYKVFEIF